MKTQAYVIDHNEYTNRVPTEKERIKELEDLCDKRMEVISALREENERLKTAISEALELMTMDCEGCDYFDSCRTGLDCDDRAEEVLKKSIGWTRKGDVKA